MLRQASKRVGKDDIAQGKFRPTEYNTAILIEAFFEAIVEKQITEIPSIGRFVYNAAGEITRFSPFSSFSRALTNNHDKLTAPRLDDSELNVLAQKTGLLEDDIKLALSSLTTYMLEELAERQSLTIPKIGKLSFEVIVTSRPRATFSFKPA